MHLLSLHPQCPVLEQAGCPNPPSFTNHLAALVFVSLVHCIHIQDSWREGTRRRGEKVIGKEGGREEKEEEEEEMMSTAPDVLRSFAVCHLWEDVFLNQGNMDEFTSEMRRLAQLSTQSNLCKMAAQMTSVWLRARHRSQIVFFTTYGTNCSGSDHVKRMPLMNAAQPVGLNRSYVSDCKECLVRTKMCFCQQKLSRLQPDWSLWSDFLFIAFLLG